MLTRSTATTQVVSHFLCTGAGPLPVSTRSKVYSISVSIVPVIIGVRPGVARIENETDENGDKYVYSIEFAFG